MNRKKVQLGIALILFLLALTVRSMSLDVFVTIDEPRWVDRSRHFLSGLLYPDYECEPAVAGRTVDAGGLGCTFQVGYPGVITMWGGALGLFIYYWQEVQASGLNLRDFLASVPIKPIEIDMLAYMRVPLIIINSLFIPFFYLFGQKFFSWRVALIATLFIALGPFYIALSQVLHHDMLTTLFIIPAIFALIGYYLMGFKKRWLVASAIFGGLAFLCKPVSWYLIPFVPMISVVGLWYRWHRGLWQGWLVELKQVIINGVLWMVIAFGVFVLLFPAMWVIPGQVLSDMFIQNTHLTGKGHSQFFLGQVSNDPGFLFYPVGWFLRVSPFEVLGLLLFFGGYLAFIWHAIIQKNIWSAHLKEIKARPFLFGLLLFTLTFFLFIGWASKKNVRYGLPVFVALDVFVAFGLVWGLNFLQRWQKVQTFSRHIYGLGIALIVGTQLISLSNHHPYYFTYYNPLFGGTRGAANYITIIGWGEGMNEVADYLNSLPEADEISVSAWYNHTLGPFLDGKANDFSETRIDAVLEKNYVVYYYNQLQRDAYDPSLWTYLNQSYQPVYTLTLQGINYTYVYKSPITNTVKAKDNGLPDVFQVLGYNLNSTGQVKLFWQNFALQDDDLLALGLEPVVGGDVIWQSCEPYPAFAPKRNIPQTIVESACPLPKNLSANAYHLRLGIQHGEQISPANFPGGEFAVGIDQSGAFVALDKASAFDFVAKVNLPASARSLDLFMGDIVWLRGYQVESTADTAEVVLYWQPTAKLDLDYAQAFQLKTNLYLPQNETPVATLTHPLFSPDTPPESLVTGAIMPTSYQIKASDINSADFDEISHIEICLRVAANDQPVFAVTADEQTAYECVALIEGN